MGGKHGKGNEYSEITYIKIGLKIRKPHKNFQMKNLFQKRERWKSFQIIELNFVTGDLVVIVVIRSEKKEENEERKPTMALQCPFCLKKEQNEFNITSLKYVELKLQNYRNYEGISAG